MSPEPADTRQRLSADVLFRSIAGCCAAETCAVILTGMSDDGVLGMRSIHEGLLSLLPNCVIIVPSSIQEPRLWKSDCRKSWLTPG